MLFFLAASATTAGATQVNWGGYADAAVLYSSNEPSNNQWRSKGTSATLNEPRLNNTAFTVTKHAATDSPWGFTIGVQAGDDVDAQVSDAAVGSAETLKYLYYTNATYLFDVGAGLAVTGGLLPGHIGYESFHAGDNPTYTRIYGVDNVPYFQWGVVAKYPYEGAVSVGVMVATGWDYLSSPNSVPSYGGRLHWDIDDSAWLRGNVFWGAEQQETAVDFWRLALEGMGEVDIGDFGLVGNLGWGREKQAMVPGTPRYQWSWGALWLNWKPRGGPWSVGLRPEFFRDEDGLLTSSRQTISALTAALRYEITTRRQQFQVRAEYRFDHSTGPDGGFYRGADNLLVPDQQLFMLALNWRFDSAGQ